MLPSRSIVCTVLDVHTFTCVCMRTLTANTILVQSDAAHVISSLRWVWPSAPSNSTPKIDVFCMCSWVGASGYLWIPMHGHVWWILFNVTEILFHTYTVTIGAHTHTHINTSLLTILLHHFDKFVSLWVGTMCAVCFVHTICVCMCVCVERSLFFRQKKIYIIKKGGNVCGRLVEPARMSVRIQIFGACAKNQSTATNCYTSNRQTQR